jgi:hypothetical protein
MKIGVLALALVATLASTATLAASEVGDTWSRFAYGAPATGAPGDRTVHVGVNSHRVNVAHGETVRFVAESGDAVERSYERISQTVPPPPCTLERQVGRRLRLRSVFRIMCIMLTAKYACGSNASSPRPGPICCGQAQPGRFPRLNLGEISELGENTGPQRVGQSDHIQSWLRCSLDFSGGWLR